MSGRSSPAAALMIVDLPEPDGPNSTVTPGDSTSNAISIWVVGKWCCSVTEKLIASAAILVLCLPILAEA